MADDNLPAEDAGPVDATPQTYDDQVEGLSDLLEDPEEDHPEEKADEAADDSEAAEDTPEDDDPLGLDADDDAEDVETDDADDPDGQQAEIKGGRFAPDSAKVKLDDGSVISVSDLKGRVEKRVKEFQRDYTEKTTALKAHESEVDEYAQSLNQSRDYLAWYAETHVPKHPEPFTGDPDRDPHAYLKWQRERDRWQEHVQAWQEFQRQKQADEERHKGETEKEAHERFDREAEALRKAMPVLRDPVKGPQAMTALRSGASQYGYSEAEVSSIADHRHLVVLRDALAYRRIKSKAPQVQAEVARKPAPKPGQRAAPQSRDSKERKVRSERLRRTGSFEDGVASLETFDL